MKGCLSLLTILIAVGWTGCAQPLAPDAPGDPVPLIRLSVEPHAFSVFSAVDRPQRFVIRDAATLAQQWPAWWSTMSQPPRMPDLDFSREMLVVVALGAKPTSGYDVVLDSAARRDDRLTIYVRTTAPPPGSVVLTVITHPIDLARVSRTDGAVLFQDLS